MDKAFKRYVSRSSWPIARAIEHRNLYYYFIAIFVTVWVILFPKSRLPWKAFPGLPTPPAALEAYFS